MIKNNLLKYPDVEYLNISKRKLQYLVQEGKLLCVKIDRTTRFRLEDVQAFVEFHLVGSAE